MHWLTETPWVCSLLCPPLCRWWRWGWCRGWRRRPWCHPATAKKYVRPSHPRWPKTHLPSLGFKRFIFLSTKHGVSKMLVLLGFGFTAVGTSFHNHWFSSPSVAASLAADAEKLLGGGSSHSCSVFLHIANRITLHFSSSPINIPSFEQVDPKCKQRGGAFRFPPGFDTSFRLIFKFWQKRGFPLISAWLSVYFPIFGPYLHQYF